MPVAKPFHAVIAESVQALKFLGDAADMAVVEHVQSIVVASSNKHSPQHW